MVGELSTVEIEARMMRHSPSLAVVAAFSDGQSSAEVMQENANATLLCGLSEVIRWPILFVDLLFGERNRLRFDYGPVRENVAPMDDGRGVVVLARMPALRMVRAGAGFRFQVDAVSSVAALGRLARNKPSAVVQTVEPTGCRDDEAALLSGVHFRNLRDCRFVYTIVGIGGAIVNQYVVAKCGFFRVFLVFIAA
jgi:hypothetical protein